MQIPRTFVSSNKSLSIRAAVASLVCSVRLARFGLALKRYNPDQPRAPAGQPDGGQWTGGGDSRPMRVAQVEIGRSHRRTALSRRRRYCVYRFSYGDIIVPGPNIAACMERMPWFGAVHGRMLNDN